MAHTCPGFSHDSQAERILANLREVVEILARCRVTNRGGEGESTHAGTPCVPSDLDDWPKYDGCWGEIKRKIRNALRECEQ